MNGTKLTAGPWHLRADDYGIDIRAGNDYAGHVDIATVGWDREAKDDPALANARLIAAAPDLLDLARNVAGFDDSLLVSAGLSIIRAALREWRIQAREAIAKAEGPPSTPRSTPKRSRRRSSIASKSGSPTSVVC